MEIMVENFVLLNELPVLIITGNSPMMKELVEMVLERHELKSEPETFWNLGSLIIKER